MSSRIARTAARLALAAFASGVIAGAGAGEFHSVGGYQAGGYGPAHGYGPRGSAYGFADEAVRGTYIGAPLTRFPSPSQIVPAPWTYGTYGVPTVAGIQQAPIGRPSITVVHAREPAFAPRQRSGARILSRDGDGGWARTDADGDRPSGVRIIEVQVPRR